MIRGGRYDGGDCGQSGHKGRREKAKKAVTR